MRKYLYLATAAASIAALAAPVAAGAASTAKSDVLTVGKAGGAAVKTKAVLKARLAKGATAVFSLGSQKLTCKSASFTATVTANPAAPGKATESLTAESLGKCTVNVAHITVKTIKADNLPYDVTVSGSKGDPVTVTGTSKKKPVELTATVNYQGNPVVCTYKTSSVKGAGSNKGNTITITKQKFTLVTGFLCPKSANFAATYGPVKDTSVHGSPAVFIN